MKVKYRLVELMSKNNTYKKSNKNFKKTMRGGEFSSHNNYAQAEAVCAVPLQVRVYNGNFDKALRAFRALVQKERILSSYKEKQSFEKKSDKRRRKRNEAKRKLMELSSERNKVKSFKKENHSDLNQN